MMEGLGVIIARRRERKKAECRALAIQNIRVTSAYHEVDLDAFSDEEIETASLTKFHSLKDFSHQLDIGMAVYMKTQLVLNALRRSKRAKSI
jgi:hypothetical protein